MEIVLSGEQALPKYLVLSCDYLALGCQKTFLPLSCGAAAAAWHITDLLSTLHCTAVALGRKSKCFPVPPKFPAVSY